MIFLSVRQKRFYDYQSDFEPMGSLMYPEGMYFDVLHVYSYYLLDLDDAGIVFPNGIKCTS